MDRKLFLLLVGMVALVAGWTRPLTAEQDIRPRHRNYTRVVLKNAHVGDNLMPLVNRVAALLKRWLTGTHQGAIKASHIDYYLDEYTFRFNRRTLNSRGRLLYSLIQQAVEINPVPVAQSARKQKRGRPQHIVG